MICLSSAVGQEGWLAPRYEFKAVLIYATCNNNKMYLLYRHVLVKWKNYLTVWLNCVHKLKEHDKLPSCFYSTVVGYKNFLHGMLNTV